MNIPEGFKLVPTELLERVVCLDNGFRQHRQAQYDLVKFLAAPVPPQVEAQPVASRESFERAVLDKAERIQPDLSRHGLHPDAEYRCSNIQWAWELVSMNLFTHSDAGELSQCGAMARMIEEKEWAEHSGTGPVSSRVEVAFTTLHNELSEAHETADTLRAQVEAMHASTETVNEVMVRMRAQLAERDARIHEVVEGFQFDNDGCCINLGRDFARAWIAKVEALSATKEG